MSGEAKGGAAGEPLKILRSIWRIIQAPVLAILGGMIIGAVIMLITGYNPISAYVSMMQGAFGGRNLYFLVSNLKRATPIIGMGLTAAIAFRGGFLNIGGEGQLVLGGVTAALASLYIPLPAPLLLPLIFLLAMAVAGFWAWLAAFFQVRVGMPILITTLLLNYPARHFASFLVTHPFRDVESGMNQSHLVPEQVRLASFQAGGQLHVGVLIILAAVILAAFVMNRTVAGYELKMTGLNPRFAEYGGVRRDRLAYRTMFISGAVAGLVGAIEVLGVHYRFIDGMLVKPLYAWTGVMTALLSNASPIGVLFAGLFFSSVQTGGFNMERGAGVPRELARVIQAVIIMLVAARESFNMGGTESAGESHE